MAGWSDGTLSPNDVCPRRTFGAGTGPSGGRRPMGEERAADAAGAPPSGGTDAAGARFICPGCGTDITDTARYLHFRVCEICHRHFAMGAAERIARLVDHDSFKETSADLRSADPLGFADRLPYPERLEEAQ